MLKGIARDITDCQPELGFETSVIRHHVWIGGQFQERRTDVLSSGVASLAPGVASLAPGVASLAPGVASSAGQVAAWAPSCAG